VIAHAIPFAAGALFAAGLLVGGMTQPQKVVQFLDVGGAWDPSLAFVMAGAIAVHAPAYLWARRRSAPWAGGAFSLPTRRDIDLPLVAGAALFGLGWGLAGYCPGPAVTALATGRSDVVLVVASMVAGMAAHRAWERRRAAPPPRPLQPD
jgi:uncharacterized membrane protein YedE/YeeE